MIVLGMIVMLHAPPALALCFARAIFGDRIQERTALHPEQPRAEKRDQPIAEHFDPPDRAVHGAACRAKQHRGDADNGDRHQRLQHRRSERQRHAAPPGLAVGHDIGRDHRLAVTGPGGMKNACKPKEQAEQVQHRAAIDLGGANRRRQTAIEFGLLGQIQPTKPSAGTGAARRTERIALREGRITNQGHKSRHGRRRADTDQNNSAAPDAAVSI